MYRRDRVSSHFFPQSIPLVSFVVLYAGRCYGYGNQVGLQKNGAEVVRRFPAAFECLRSVNFEAVEVRGACTMPASVIYYLKFYEEFEGVLAC